MTPEETITTLELAISEIEWNYPLDISIALETAIEALKKQIPRKPKILKVHDISKYKYGDCQCGEHIMDDENYCSNCGQKLSWESDAE